MTSLKTFPTRIDIAADNRQKLIALLNQQLADTTDLFTQTKQAHWNVKGPQFIPLHELFDTFAGQLIAAVDDIAERVTALGGTAAGTARMAAAASRLSEYPTDAITGAQHLNALADRFAHVAKTTRAAIDTAAGLADANTADLFTGLSRDLDKSLWFIEAHLLT